MKYVSHNGGITDSTGVYNSPINFGTTQTGTKSSSWDYATSSSVFPATGNNQIRPAGNAITVIVDPTQAFTAQLWTKHADTSADFSRTLMTLELSNAYTFVWRVGTPGSGSTVYFGKRGPVIYPDVSTYQLFTSTDSAPQISRLPAHNAWTHHSLSYDGLGETSSNFNYRVNGTVGVTLADNGNMPYTSGVGGINRFGIDDSNYYPFRGDMGEIRLTQTHRTVNYQATDYNVQTSNSLITVGTPEPAAITPHDVIASDSFTISEVSLYRSNGIFVSSEDDLVVTETATNNIRAVSVHDTVTIGEEAIDRDAMIAVHSTDSLILNEVARQPVVYLVKATDYPALSVSIATRGVIRVSATDDITPTFPIIDPYTGLVASYLHGLYDTTAISKRSVNRPSDTLKLGESASCRVIPNIGRSVSASDTITIVDHAGMQGTVDNIVLGEMALAFVCKPAGDSLIVGETASIRMIRSLHAVDALVIEESFVCIKPYDLAKRDYTPFIGHGTAGNPTPPPVTLTLPGPNPGEFTLFWPAIGTATDTLVLRDPEFGNKDRLQYNRISRETRGGTLVVFADPMWPKIQTQVLSFSALTPTQAEALLEFMERHLGLEIGMWDWEGRRWTGVIVNPTEPVVQDSKYSFTGSFEFEGQLV